MSKTKYNTSYLLGISVVSALGGLLFGYDWVVIGGAKPFYERFFEISNSPFLQGWTMSSALMGCLLGAMLSGALSDKYGRKGLLIFSAFLFTASAIGTGATSNYTMFITYRILGGIGIGLASNLSPMYIAEVAPGSIRGRFVSLNQLTIVIGILAAQIVNWQIAETVAIGATDNDILNSWNGQMGWRWMFWAETIPAGLFFLLMFFVPESPRWLALNGSHAKVKDILRKVGGADYAEQEFNNIMKSKEKSEQGSRVSELLHPRMRGILIIGIVLAAFQQWCGINVIFNYAEEIFEAAGYGVSDTLMNIVITGSVNLVFTLIAIYTVDRIGRRNLMKIGAGGLLGIYMLIGGAYYFQISGIVLLFLVVLAIACFAMTLGPITWVVLSEIFPNKVRGTAMSVATASLWIASFGLTYTFPLLNRSLGASGTFWLYGLICGAGLMFIHFKLPETKGKSLEQIESELVKE